MGQVLGIYRYCFPKALKNLLLSNLTKGSIYSEMLQSDFEAMADLTLMFNYFIFIGHHRGGRGELISIKSDLKATSTDSGLINDGTVIFHQVDSAD